MLRVEGLIKHFPIRKGVLRRQVGWVRAVDGLDFTVAAGKTLSLVGESGCGKSTTGRLLARLIDPTAGRVWLDSDELTALPPARLRARRRDIQIMFQDPFSSLSPRFTVAEIIAEPLRSIAIASAACNISFAMASAVMMIFLARTLELAPAAIGLIIAAGSGAVMIGAMLTPRLARIVGSVRMVWLSLAVTTPLTMVGALAQPGWSVVLVVIGIAAGELGQIVYAITGVSLRQRICPDRLLGRVNATMTVLIMGLVPLGALAGGALGELIGARATLITTGVVALIAPVVLVRTLGGVRALDAHPDEP